MHLRTYARHRTQKIRRFGAVIAFVAGTSIGVANAQHPVHRQGLGGGQAMDGALPFEQVDPLSGNLVVTATDLILPGNAGFDLRIQRFYNSAIYPGYATGDLTLPEDSWAGIGWRLHFGRVLNPDSSASGETQIELGDGSTHPLYTTAAFPEGWITRGLGRYDRTTHTLKLPNGMAYVFGRAVHVNNTLGTVHYVTEMRDVFNNRLTFEYFDTNGPPDGVARIRQHLSASQVREVTFTYDVATKSLATMQYGSRTWRYEHEGAGPPGHTRLRFVRPPIGPAWQYEYSDTAPGHELRMIRTPNGGAVNYTYGDASHRTAAVTTLSRVVTTRVTGGRNVAPGTWTYAYDQGPNQDETYVTSPCNVTKYRFIGHGATGDFSAWSAGALVERTLESGGELLERETLSYVRSDPISPDYVAGTEGILASDGVFNALLSQRTIRRGTEEWTTTYAYHGGDGTFNDFGQPWEITELQGVYHLRETVRTFNHTFVPYIRGRVASERLRVRTAYDEFSGPITRHFTYDANTGFLTRQSFEGLVTDFDSHPDGNVKAIVDGLGNRTAYEYSWGRVRQATTPHVTMASDVSSDGTIGWEGVGGLGTAYTYDEAFRPLTVTPTNTAPFAYAYDNVHGAFASVARGSAVTRSELDGFGRTVLSQGPDGVFQRTDYDPCGRAVFESAPYSTGTGTRGVTTTYDGLGRGRTVTPPDGSVTTYSYAGLDTAVTTPVTGSQTRTTTYRYRSFGAPAFERLMSVTDGLGQTTSYKYDVFNNLIRVDVPGVPARTWTYNERGQLVSETQPESGTTTYTYDAAGNRKTITNALGEVTTFSYDGNNRLTFVDAPGTADDVTITYDPTYGRFVSQARPGVTTTVGYDAAGRLRSRTDTINGQSFTATSEFTSVDGLASITYPSQRVVSYAYDTAGRLTAVHNNGAVFADAFSYHPETGALQSYRTGATVHSFAYDNRDRLQQLDASVGGTRALDLTYTYDAASQVVGIVDGRPNQSQTFTYDAVRRLKTATGSYGYRVWTFDAAGNRLTESGEATTVFHYDTARQWLTSTSGAAAETFTYDALGRLRTDARGTYSYSSSNQLIGVTAPNVSASYEYAADGQRLRRTVNGVTVYSIGGQEVLSEFVSACGEAPAWSRDYVYAGDRLLGAVRANATRPTVTFHTASTSATEVQGAVSVGVQVETPNAQPTGCAITVSYHTTAGTAVSPLDFATAASNLTIAAGTASGTVVPVAVTVAADSLDESNETFSVQLSAALGATLGATTSHAVTITDDDAAPTLTIGDVNLQEGNAGTVNAVFAVALSSASGQGVQVTYATGNGTATAGLDYQATSGTLTIAAGLTSATITVPVLGDGLVEPNETFTLTLSSVVNATLADAQGLGTIVNDDVARKTWGDMYTPHDGAADGTLFNPDTGAWALRDSASGAYRWLSSMGQPNDIPVPADYTGDGRTDCASYRPSTGGWLFAVNCQSPFTSDQWGGDPTDVPVPGDYDGDLVADVAVFRRGSNSYFWYIRLSASYATSVREWGWTWTTSIPVQGDYDGDGKTDPAYFAEYNAGWWILPSNGSPQFAIDFGFPGTTHVPAPGDYDGDGRTDPAFFYPGDNGWYIRPSSTGVSYRLSFGAAGIIPTPADYDVDGRTDPAYYDKAAGGFYVWRSSTGTTQFIPMAVVAGANDIPVLKGPGPPPPAPPPPPPVCIGPDPFAALGGGTCCPNGDWVPPGMACGLSASFAPSEMTTLACAVNEPRWRLKLLPLSASQANGGGLW